MQFSQVKLLPVLIVILLVFLQYRLWFESGGVIDMLHLKKQLAVQQQENGVLKRRNDDLMFEVHRLQANQEAIESRARQELGMIKKGETFYQIVSSPR